MATIYNLTNTTNSTNLYDVTLGLNQASGGLAVVILLFTGWLITMIAMKGWENKDAFTASSFGFMVISGLLFAANLVPMLIFLFFGGMTAFSIAFQVLRP